MKPIFTLVLTAALLACARLCADNPQDAANVAAIADSLQHGPIVVSDARKAELETLSKSAVEDFAARLSKIPKLVVLFNDSLTKPSVVAIGNPPYNFGFRLRLDHGVVIVPSKDPAHSQASFGPSYPDGSCSITFFAGTFGAMMTTTGAYRLPIMQNFSIKYFFKINPSDPSLEKSVDDAFQQTVLDFALKAGMTSDDIKKFLPGLPAISPGDVATPALAQNVSPAPAGQPSMAEQILEARATLSIYNTAKSTPPPAQGRAQFLLSLIKSTLEKFKTAVFLPQGPASILGFKAEDFKETQETSPDGTFYIESSATQGMKMVPYVSPDPNVHGQWAKVPSYPPGAYSIGMYFTNSKAPMLGGSKSYLISTLFPSYATVGYSLHLGTPNPELEAKVAGIFDSLVLDFLVKAGTSKADILKLYPQLATLASQLPDSTNSVSAE